MVKDLLTYHTDITAEKAQKWRLIRLAKAKKNSIWEERLRKEIKALEDKEWVCWFHDNQFPTGHLILVKALLEEIKVNCHYIEKRVIPEKYLTLRWKNEPFKPRYYQEEMIDLGLKNHRGVFELAVGTGKTLGLIYLIKNLGVNSLIITPSSGLKEQLYQELIIHFGINNIQKIDTSLIRKNGKLKPIRITTIQTLASLQKTGDIQYLVEDIDAVYVDEIHHSGSETYLNLLKDIEHIYYRFGFTGTFIRNDSKTLDMWGFLSVKLQEYKAKKAIIDGFLTPIKAIIYDIPGKPSKYYPTEYKRNYCENPILLKKIMRILKSISPDDQVLMLVNRKDKSGLVVHKFLTEAGFKNSYISGDDDAKKINSTISDFNSKKVKILIGSSVIGEGIDVRSADHLIMLQGGKSPVVIVQAVGRLARLFAGKLFGTIHDFKFKGTKYMVKHLNQRIQIYKDNFDPEIIWNKEE